MSGIFNQRAHVSPVFCSRHSIAALSFFFLYFAHHTQAASDCQPIFDAYAAQAKAPVLQKTVTTPGMADPVELILTQDAMFSRIGSAGEWSKMILDDAMREGMKKGAPSLATIADCVNKGSLEVDGVSGKAYEFTPSEALGNVPGERLTVLIDSKSGLPVSETTLKAGTKAKILYDGVAVPAQ